MQHRTDVIYTYDGSWDGLLCCVHLYYYSNFNPVSIVTFDGYNPSFFDNVEVITDNEKSIKVKTAIKTKTSNYIYTFLQECFLSDIEEKEKLILHFIIKGFKQGKNIIDNLSDETVISLFKTHKQLKREAHRYLGLVRFYKAEDIYISIIEPWGQILPLIAYHFSHRYAKQQFIIYDKAHCQAMLHINKEYKIVHADSIELPPITKDEKEMQRLWKGFCQAISIEERHNPKCRMNFMPKRTWTYLPEMQE